MILTKEEQAKLIKKWEKERDRTIKNAYNFSEWGHWTFGK